MDGMFTNIGFVTGAGFGLIIGATVGLIVMMLLQLGNNVVNETIVAAANEMPPGYMILIKICLLGGVSIRVTDWKGRDTAFVDNHELDLNERILLAEEHVINVDFLRRNNSTQSEIAA